MFALIPAFSQREKGVHYSIKRSEEVPLLTGEVRRGEKT